jgi:hypothetical protein
VSSWVQIGGWGHGRNGIGISPPKVPVRVTSVSMIALTWMKCRCVLCFPGRPPPRPQQSHPPTAIS